MPRNNQFDPSAAVTGHDLTAAAAIDRLTALLDAPVLTLTATGAGLPDGGVNLMPEQALVISRDEVAGLIRFLRQLPPDATGVGDR